MSFHKAALLSQVVLLLIPTTVAYIFGFAYSIVLLGEPGRSGMTAAALLVGVFLFSGWKLMVAALGGVHTLIDVPRFWWWLSGVAAVLGVASWLRLLLNEELSSSDFLGTLSLSLLLGVPLIVPYLHCLVLRIGLASR